MAKSRWANQRVEPDAAGNVSLEKRRQVLLDTLRAEVGETTVKVEATWHWYINVWEIELKDLKRWPSPKPWWKFW